MTMGLPSALLMSRQLLKAIYSVITCCLYVANILHLQIVYCSNCSNTCIFKIQKLAKTKLLNPAITSPFTVAVIVTYSPTNSKVQLDILDGHWVA